MQTNPENGSRTVHSTDRKQRSAELPSTVASRSAKRARWKKSTLLGVYLYIAAHNNLREEQREYIAHFQAKLNLAEIQRALKFAHVLTTSPRDRATMHVDSVQVPTLPARPKRREQRRIGVGYRDKGSLRPPHRPVLPVQITLGVESAMFYGGILPPEIQAGNRKDADEVMSDWRETPLGPVPRVPDYGTPDHSRWVEQYLLRYRPDVHRLLTEEPVD